jgi:glycosyltransferase involved in cell wall biosynthesis
MRIDTHVHSKHSKRPSQWVLQKIGCPESFTEPPVLYKTAKKRGMDWVTITDHNVIDGCLEIAHLPNTFISEEVTTYFPEDRCKLHCLVYDINEAIHQDIQKIRENVYDLTAYLRQNNITHALAHPLYSVNQKLTLEHFEKVLLLFKTLELNGARSEEQNRCIEMILAVLGPEDISRLADKHGIDPYYQFPWRKGLIGGSDDHSSLTIARRHTEVERAATVAEFLEGVEHGRTRVLGPGSTPLTLAHNLYSIAYQFYEHKFQLERYLNSDILLSFLHRFLQLDQCRAPRLFERLNLFLAKRRSLRATAAGRANMTDILRCEAYRLTGEDPELSRLLKNGNGDARSLDEQWFKIVDRVSNKVLGHFTDQLVNNLSGADLLSVFGSLGSAGSLYCILAPYFVSFAVFSEDRQFGRRALKHFLKREIPDSDTPDGIKVAHFTDTLYEVNGVAGNLNVQLEAAERLGKDCTLVTCDADNHPNGKGRKNFKPIGVYEPTDYPGVKLYYPPFPEMLDYCYRENFSHIHAATPGPIGLAALAIARILRLPLVATYHTSLPEYLEALTGDGSIAEMSWTYLLWFYDQASIILTPSKYAANELAEKGVDPAKIRLVPRGVDIEKFHPDKAPRMAVSENGSRPKKTLLYVGRISREKNLPLLVNVFKDLNDMANNIQLMVVGDGPYRTEMVKELKGLPCTFTGCLEGDRLSAAYASADLFVFPSATDTFGTVVLEAQASGLPVIVSDMGGPRENVVHGSTGLVVNGNDEVGLLNAIVSLIRDPERLETMGRAARQYAEGRSFDAAFEQAWGVYLEAGAERPPSKALSNFSLSPEALISTTLRTCA